ncbi:hypothetical protein IB260_28680 [Pseudomonas sp. PDM23]|uniref:hypothetical protein n=1 Tax=unclassified Pseudomonas TaxID=196821 RepID=UPI00177C98C4|nr:MULTISPECIES: hypothetical protein [unclassified Pseudomonas]MBD9579331.1 hypothetical protein [Pseudomonas sp. PDM23]MBD9672328.1 hypothetical protein [Pseudomonas sp. PDM21]
MNTLLVAHVEPYAPGSESASVTLKSSHGEIEVFCYPCYLKAGDRVENFLFALDANARAASLSDWPSDEIEERGKERLQKVGPYAYQGCGRVLDRSSGLVEVLGFHIELGAIPCDGAVDFEISRVDL